ncbi:hypothetical protein DUI87_07494 [Hirundo rustica rustica]|uniref:Uncharacterized protein n=1 Tax=Hirundo rustica rustica TaxID=333673 RepID=A0A3M0KQ71_HIRRU|nr:hypothetical protein DUI87_07494 [Hirundo rustica rustica]
MAWTLEQEEEEGQQQAAVTSALQLAAVDTSGCAASLMLYRCHVSSLCAGVKRRKTFTLQILRSVTHMAKFAFGPQNGLKDISKPF